MIRKLGYSTITIFLLAACSENSEEMDMTEATSESAAEETAAATQNDNPFFQPSPLFMLYPPFDQIDNSHYLPAFQKGMRQQLGEIDAIVNQSDIPA